jgi:hypothetical protein
MKSVPRYAGVILFACLIVGAAGATSPPQGGMRLPPKPIKTTPPKEWPDPETTAKQKKNAETRALFESSAPLEFTLTGNFKQIQGDRIPTSTKMFPATIEFQRPDGSHTTIDLPVRTRGQIRRSYDVCDFAPIRLEFPKSQVKGTVFDGQENLKLVTHCRSSKEGEQYPLREYAAYRIFNLLTPNSFRARLVKVTYVNTPGNKSLGTHHGMLLEDDGDLAKRMEGRMVTQSDLLSRLDRDNFTLVTTFFYMIGNLDVSVLGQHNVKLVQTRNRAVFVVPYDFDYSGLVDTAYAVPPRELDKVTSVRERMYRGPCRSMPELETLFAQFRAIRPATAAMYESIPDLDEKGKKRALDFLDEFYRTLDRPNVVKRDFTANCLKKGLM